MSTPAFTPEQIEKMRAIGLLLDRAGRFWHDGSEVTHPRLRQALLRWLDVRDDDGRDIVKLDDVRYAYVEVEDAHLRAASARWDGDRCTVQWDDGSEEELDYAHLAERADHAIATRARGGRLRGTIGGAAHQTVTQRIAPAGDGFVLRAAGRDWPISAPAPGPGAT
jgi:hypothetical protein